MATEKAPAFQFYPKDFLTDGNVTGMSLQERGAYITLICLCWLDGSIAAEPSKLARSCGVPLTAFRRLWPALEPCFRASGSDAARLVHPRLEKERAKQEHFRRRNSDNGKQGGRPTKPTVNPTETQPLTQPEAKKSSPVSDLRSPSPERTNTTVFVSVPTALPDELTERAGDFCRRYAELYPQYRKGARYLPKPALDHAKACELCAVWDDARLEKLASAFLQTDHDFAANGSRTIGQFAALASWCDDRLREEGL